MDKLQTNFRIFEYKSSVMGTQDILNLSVSERLSLINQIWSTIDTTTLEISSAQKKELDKRMDRVNSGETTFSSWAEVKKRLRS